MENTDVHVDEHELFWFVDDKVDCWEVWVKRAYGDVGENAAEASRMFFFDLEELVDDKDDCGVLEISNGDPQPISNESWMKLK